MKFPKEYLEEIKQRYIEMGDEAGEGGDKIKEENEKAIYCSNCGFQNNASEKYCTNCGTKLHEHSKKNEEKG